MIIINCIIIIIIIIIIKLENNIGNSSISIFGIIDV